MFPQYNMYLKLFTNDKFLKNRKIHFSQETYYIVLIVFVFLLVFHKLKKKSTLLKILTLLIYA